MSMLTFDWAQIAYIGSPLVIPWWAEVNIFVGFFVTFWVVVPALYYSNVRLKSRSHSYRSRALPGLEYLVSSNVDWSRI